MTVSTTQTTTHHSGADEGSGNEPEDPGSSPISDSEPEPESSSDHLTPDAAAIEVYIDDDVAEDLDVDADWLLTNLEAVAAHVAGHHVERLTVRVVGDATMTTLHRDHCGLNSTTDVLTFDQSDGGDAIVADIAVCACEAARQATSRDHTVNLELLLYAVHGLLHCAGYDDHDVDDYRRMHREEDRLLGLVGLGPVFQADSDPAEGGSS